MQLLVSVSSPVEACAAVEGGADLIDAKDPRAGALGAVSVDRFREIHRAVRGRRPVTAAIGDAGVEAAIGRLARAFAESGATFVKVGFGGAGGESRVRAVIDAVIEGVRAAGGHTRVVAVAYADADRVASLDPNAITRIAAASGVDGLLVDTADKAGPGLREMVAPSILADWVGAAHRAGLFVAVAGKLTDGDLGFACDTGADIAGVRGAACVGGRLGPVDVARVRLLRQRMAPGTPKR
jgi:hypothetical protein